MYRILSAIAGIALIAASADAQTYRCEHGELVGGEAGISARCTVNSAGQITSVTPYKNTSRDRVKIYRSGDVAAPVQSKTHTAERAYRPSPLKPLPKDMPRQYQASRTISPHAPSAYPPETTVRMVTHSEPVKASRPSNIITAAPTASIQRAAYASPCTFKIREIKASNNADIYEVCYSDITATDRRSLRKLYSRITRASRRACGTDYDSILTRWGKANSACVAKSVDRAVMTSGLDPLRAYHLAKTGKGVPTVYVGAPRDAS